VSRKKGRARLTARPSPASGYGSSLPLMALVTVFAVLQCSNLVYSLIFNDWSFTYRRTIKRFI